MVLSFSLGRSDKVVRVTGFSARRVPAVYAQALYDDLSPPAAPAQTAAAGPRRDRGAGRPTKKERRALQAFARKGQDL